MSASSEWAHALAQWGIPERILSLAPQSPWIHPTDSFRPRGDLAVDTPSRRRALEALVGVERPSVLDVGCGGGRAALALVPPASALVGVDHQADMLTVFADEARARGVSAQTVLGDWPGVAARTPVCDVVVCHHVVFNVADVPAFARALDDHARRRVVLELPTRHPLSNLAPAWKRFWDLDRPDGPTSLDLVAVLAEAGIPAMHELFDEQPGPAAPVSDRDVEHTRIRLCLTPDRDHEVREFLEARRPVARQLAAVWWEVV